MRAAYGWQRDGGHAEYMLAEENTLVLLPDELTYLDGALVACGFGTAYEALQRVNLSGSDSVLTVGLGPVGLAASMLAKTMGATKLIGVDAVDDRIELAMKLGLIDVPVKAGDDALQQIRNATGEHGAEVVFDASGSPEGTSSGDSGGETVGTRCVCRRGQHGSVRAQPRYHPQTDHHIRVLGNKPAAYGGPGGEVGSLGSPPGRDCYTYILTG